MTPLDRFLHRYCNKVDINEQHQSVKIEGGWYTAKQLREIADAIDEKTRSVSVAASMQGSQP